MEQQVALPRAASPFSMTTGKLSENLAARIVERVQTQRLPVGSFLGSEELLCNTLRASRSVVREAIAILEGVGFVEVRRGKTGGLFVSRPDPQSVANCAGLYLRYRGVSPESAVRLVTILDRLVLQTIREDGTGRLRLVKTEHVMGGGSSVNKALEVYKAILAMADNPIIEALLFACVRLAVGAATRSSLSDDELHRTLARINNARFRQLDALIRDDIALAYAQEDDVLNGILDILRSAIPAGEHSRLPQSIDGGHFKRSEILTEQIISDIIALGWPEGHHLGSEQELLSHYAVSRITFRQAIRTLEELGYVEMRLGGDSGLKVARPDFQQTVDRVRWQLALMEIREDQTNAIFNVIAIDLIQSAAPNNLSNMPYRCDFLSILSHLAERENNAALSLALSIVSPG